MLSVDKVRLWLFSSFGNNPFLVRVYSMITALWELLLNIKTFCNNMILHQYCVNGV